jgi:glucokinase
MEKPFAIGIDVGGTKIAAALVDCHGHISARSFALVPSDIDTEGVIALIGAAIAEARGDLSVDRIAGIGVAVPCFVDTEEQQLLHCVNLPLAGCNLRDRLTQSTGLPVIMHNDATLAVLGEERYGVARGLNHVLMITLGTGVGGGLFLDGKLFGGARGLAGEIGHITIVADGDPCPCGGKGHLESYLGRAALARKAQEAAAGPEGSGILKRAGGNVDDITAETLLEAAEAGDVCALDILRQAGDLLGQALASFVNVLNPELIVIAGGLSQRASSLVEAARARLREEWPPGIIDVTVATGQLGNDAGILGAAALAFSPTVLDALAS